MQLRPRECLPVCQTKSLLHTVTPGNSAQESSFPRGCLRGSDVLVARDLRRSVYDQVADDGAHAVDAHRDEHHALLVRLFFHLARQGHDAVLRGDLQVACVDAVLADQSLAHLLAEGCVDRGRLRFGIRRLRRLRHARCR